MYVDGQMLWIDKQMDRQKKAQMGRQKKHRQIDAMDTGPEGYMNRRNARQIDEWVDRKRFRWTYVQKEVQMDKYKG